MQYSFFPPLVPSEPKSIFEIATDFTYPFREFVSWCGRRLISEIRQKDFFTEVVDTAHDNSSVVKTLYDAVQKNGLYEDGNFICRTPEDITLILTHIFDSVSKRVTTSDMSFIGNATSKKRIDGFHMAPCNVMYNGMEAWGICKETPLEKPYMIALYLPPEFSRPDVLETFISTSSLLREPASRSGSTAPYSQSETMWAMLLDACVSSQCTSFVVTSYSRWVMGEFSPGFETAEVSQILNISSQKLPVHEALCYWTRRAFELSQRTSDFPQEPSDQGEWPLTFTDMQYTYSNSYKLYSLFDFQ